MNEAQTGTVHPEEAGQPTNTEVADKLGHMTVAGYLNETRKRDAAAEVLTASQAIDRIAGPREDEPPYFGD